MTVAGHGTAERAGMNPDETFRSWMADFENIRDDTFELFALRRTFRDIADVFKGNARLQATGGHLWDWMVLNYVAAVLIRIRRMVDSQDGTVCLKQLMHAIIKRPDVITRGRRRAIHGPIELAFLRESVDREFTDTWVRQLSAENPADDHLDPEIVQTDLRQLEDALERVTQLAHRTVAHRQRVAPGEVTYRELDAAFEAVEHALQKYHVLLLGGSLLQAEPMPQFNTHEVFTFPWITPVPEEGGA